MHRKNQIFYKSIFILLSFVFASCNSNSNTTVKTDTEGEDSFSTINAELRKSTEKHYCYQYLHGEDIEFKLTCGYLGKVPSKVDVISADNPEVVYAKDVPVVNGIVTLSTENSKFPKSKDSIPQYGFVFKSNNVTSNSVYIELLEKEYEALETKAWNLLTHLTPEYSPYTFKLLDSEDPDEKDIAKLSYYFDHGHDDIKTIVDLSNWTDVKELTEREVVGASNNKTVELILPPNLEVLDTYISSWNAIKKIKLPETVKDIHYFIEKSNEYQNPFRGCDSLEEIIVSENSDYLKVVDGVLFSKDEKVLINYPAGKTEEEYTVPSGVEILAEESFRHTLSLKKVTVSEGVTNIGYGTFEECENLETVNLSSTVCSTGVGAFSKTNIKTITLPVHWQKDSGAFTNAKKLQEFKIDPENTYNTVEDGVLIRCSGSRELYCYPIAKPGSFYKTPENITAICSAAFRYNENLEKIEITEGVKTINSYAFINCKSLNEIVFSENGLKTIEEYAFEGCSELTECEIPWGITVIESGLFKNCKKLEKLVLSGTTKEIKENICDGCSENLVIEIHTTEPPQCQENSFNKTQKIYVPDGALSAYKNADIWKDLNIEGKVF